MRLPVLMIILTYIVLILTDLYIIGDLRAFSLYSFNKPIKKERKRWWKAYLVFSVAIIGLLTVAISLPRRSASEDITAVMWMLYTVLTVIFAQIIYVVISLTGFIPKLFRKKRWNMGLWIALPISVFLLGLMWWGALIGRKQIEINEVTISSPRLPESYNGYKIVQLSDLHVGTWGQDTVFLSRLVDSVNNLKPDLIVFTGDIVNRQSSELKPFISTLGRLKAPDGVISVLGNHDYGDYISWKSAKDKRANMDSMRYYQQQMGWLLLENKTKQLVNERGDTLTIIGVGNWGEPPFSKYGNLKEAYKEDLNDSRFKILLSHNPEHWNREVTDISNIDLTLAGHTHAMQFMLKLGNFRWSPSQYKYNQWAGLYTRKNSRSEEMNIYVNVGSGEVGFPMRVGAIPEITLFTLQR